MKPEEKGRVLIPRKSLSLRVTAQQSCEKRKRAALVVVVVVVICMLYKQPSRRTWMCLWLLRGRKAVGAPSFGAGKPRWGSGERQGDERGGSCPVPKSQRRVGLGDASNMRPWPSSERSLSNKLPSDTGKKKRPSRGRWAGWLPPEPSIALGRPSRQKPCCRLGTMGFIPPNPRSKDALQSCNWAAAASRGLQVQ